VLDTVIGRHKIADLKRTISVNPPKSFGIISPLTLRILAVNLLALAVLFVGMMYVAEYRKGLIKAELLSLESKAKLFAAAISESATSPDETINQTLVEPLARQMVHRLVEASDVRARLFINDGSLMADSLLLLGPGGVVEIEDLPPPRTNRDLMKDLLGIYDLFIEFIKPPNVQPPPPLNTGLAASAETYAEVALALDGEANHALRSDSNGGLALSVAVPVLHYKQVLGALMVSRGAENIEAAVLRVRINILKWFLVALAVTILLSIYLSGTIARPIRKLAKAAETVRWDQNRKRTIPDFGNRSDEIGQLAVALREMTEALRLRMSAIERFAADVAHELKNPLSSLRSAVETAARIDDPKGRERLMAIIFQDVGRLDRLISDISDASRLDAELSRADLSTVDLGRMLETLVEVTTVIADERNVKFRLHVSKRSKLMVHGIEGRLVQVFRNLTSNALSFSPQDGTISLKVHRQANMVVAEVIDEGPGISETLEGKIFERFYSHRPSGESFGKHSGLGLSISKQIVEAHGGTIRAENRHDSTGTTIGARFIVELPAL